MWAPTPKIGDVRRASNPAAGDGGCACVSPAQRVSSVCLRIDLNPSQHKRFEEFPDDPALAGFDWDDRVYVAVVKASEEEAAIVNATDTDYRAHESQLRQNGVFVVEPCLENT